MKRIKFTWHVPKFLDLNLRKRGPYKPGDEDTFIDRIADLIVKKERGKYIKK